MSQKKKIKQKHKPCIFGSIVMVAILVIISALFYSYASVNAPQLPTPPLKDLTIHDGVELGMFTTPENLKSGTFKQILTSQFSFITSDGQISWDKFHPSPTRYNFAGLDNMVSFAKESSMPLQVHHLIWDEADSLPKWLKNGNYSQQQLLDIMHTDIRTVVGRYRGKVAEWTVVNEPFTRAQHIYGLNNWWGDHLGGGTEYIDDAFIWAHQADPNAKLILNDFYNETETSVSNAEYAYLQSAKARGVPIDGIGIQMHIDASRPPQKEAMIQNMQRFGALGFPVYITEFDINSNAVKGSDKYKSQLESKITADAVSACIESKTCVSFNVFGMTDEENFLAWLTRAKTRSHLFTSRYEPKAAFYAFRSAWISPEKGL